MFPTLSLCACCRHYPGAATRRIASLTSPAVSAFPDMAVRSACALSFSRFARRSLALRPVHSRCHRISDTLSEGFSHFVASIAAPVASGWSGCRWDLHPLESAAFSRRTPKPDMRVQSTNLCGPHHSDELPPLPIDPRPSAERRGAATEIGAAVTGPNEVANIDIRRR